MEILNQKKVILVNDETSMRKSDSSSVIYHNPNKLAQYRLLDKNRK